MGDFKKWLEQTNEGVLFILFVLFCLVVIYGLIWGFITITTHVANTIHPVAGVVCGVSYGILVGILTSMVMED